MKNWMQQAANSKEVHLEAPCTCTVADLSMAKASFNGRLTAHHHLVFVQRSGACAFLQPYRSDWMHTSILRPMKRSFNTAALSKITNWCGTLAVHFNYVSAMCMEQAMRQAVSRPVCCRLSRRACASGLWWLSTQDMPRVGRNPRQGNAGFESYAFQIHLHQLQSK